MRRNILLTLAIVCVIFATAAYFTWASWMWTAISATLLLLAVRDCLQRQHTILRNFPVVGHLRFILEALRPEIQQYFVESDISPDPIARIYRSTVYQKAKGELETVPFGSELNLYADNYSWVNHSCFPVEHPKGEYRVRIGGSQCARPYEASLFNISAMSYGSLSKEAVRALGRGAREGGFFLNTGEGGLSPYHLESGCDVVWQLGTAYFGARDERGYFDPECFRQRSRREQIKMIEIKISQGAKPGHGGILPAVKVTQEIADIRRVPVGQTVFSPPGHTAFTNPLELCRFIAQLRDLSGGKPVGFKLCLGRREEFVKICDAMVKTGIVADFISIDGGEGGTGAAPFDFINFVGSPLKEALYFVDSTLTSYGLRKEVKIIASGKIMSGFNIFESLALGADLCSSARGMMLALGCIQAYRCNTNKCPTGVATSDPRLSAGLDVTDKGLRVARYHRRTVESLTELLVAAGLHGPEEVTLAHISCRFENRIVTLAELFAHTPELSPHEQTSRGKAAQGEPSTPAPPT